MWLAALIHIKVSAQDVAEDAVMHGLWSDFLAACSSLAPAWLTAGWLESDWPWLGRPLGLLLFGLVGGASHCAGMCGPFVLSQIGSRLAELPLDQSYGLARLRGMALLPYHAGRLTTYSLLGAAAGGLAGGVERVLLQGALPALALALAALLLLAIAYRRLGAVSGGQSAAGLLGWSGMRGLFRRPTGLNGYLLGLGLGFLPCGLIYSALLLAGANGDWRQGGLMMLAFAIGTVPGLLLVGFFGAAIGARWRAALKPWLAPVLLLNAVLLLLLALRWLLR